MVFEEIEINPKDKKTHEIIKIMLNAFFENNEIKQMIADDLFVRETVISVNALSSDKEIFKDKMREDVEVVNVEDYINLLIIRYNHLEEKLMKHFINRLPTKFILMLRMVIKENLEILSNVKNKFDYKFIKNLEYEADLLTFLIDTCHEVSYEQFGNDIINLLTYHVNIQDYALQNKLLNID